MADKSSQTSNDLPKEELQKDNSTDGGNEGSEGLSTDSEQKEGLDPKTKKGFQRLVAKKDQELQSKGERLDELSRKVSKLQRQEREKKYDEMSETEKWKAKARENARKAAQAELSSLVVREASKRNIVDHAVVEILTETPWAFPAVRRRLAEDTTWDETIELVRTHLPSYLDTLVEPENATPQAQQESVEPQSEVPAEGMETERSGPTEVNKRTWTSDEITSYLREAEGDPEEYQKRRIEITQAANEGRVQ